MTAPTVPITITVEQRTGPDGQVGSEQWLVFHVPEGETVDMPEPGTKIENSGENFFIRGIRYSARIEWRHPSGVVIGRATVVDRDPDGGNPGLNYVMDDTEADARLLLAVLAAKYRATGRSLTTTEGPEDSVLWAASLAGPGPAFTPAHGVTPIHAATRLMLRLEVHFGTEGPA